MNRGHRVIRRAISSSSSGSSSPGERQAHFRCWSLSRPPQAPEEPFRTHLDTFSKRWACLRQLPPLPLTGLLWPPGVSVRVGSWAPGANGPSPSPASIFLTGCELLAESACFCPGPRKRLGRRGRPLLGNTGDEGPSTACSGGGGERGGPPPSRAEHLRWPELGMAHSSASQAVFCGHPLRQSAAATGNAIPAGQGGWLEPFLGTQGHRLLELEGARQAI